ncbi:MAG: bifunctional riboflavin kinase/FAD synthetase [Candidatus Omnitrophica bacterium]|nr:bifunctional riboflavin kinase/FAD synthetase [Candidatus Omnitrophota bacterium]
MLGIGKFDGVHSGHKKVLSIISAEAKKEGRVAGIITFRRSPVKFLLCGWKEKLSLLDKTGIEVCIWCDFNDISHLSPEEFLEILVRAGVKTIIVGHNFRFGKGRKGDVKFLKKQAKKQKFSLIVVPPFKKNGEIVSSSKIRTALKRGDIKRVNEFLGRYFSVSGKVVKGKGIGQKLGFPTANLSLENNICIGQGVYAGWVEYKRKIYKSAIVTGKSPTFNNDVNKFEVFIIDYQGKNNLYNKKIRVFLYKKIRSQIKFQNLEKLKNQIEKDIKEIKILLRKIPAPKTPEKFDRES